MGYSPYGHKKLDTNDHKHPHIHTLDHKHLRTADSGTQQTSVGIQALPLTSCVSLGKLFNLSVPGFPLLLKLE